METPKPPARSQLRRPSTRPYVRRKNASTAEPTTDPTAAATLAATTAAMAAATTTDTTIDATIVAPHAPIASTGVAPAKPRSKAKAAANPSAPAAATPGPLSTDGSRPVAAPAAAAPQVSAVAVVDEAPSPTSEDLLVLPSPRLLPAGAPAAPAPAPGRVPAGDSRSLRRGALFALVYRMHCFVVTRHGHVGQQGHWSAVQYPTPAAASHAYARSCSHWVSEGFSDYRG
ncbi:MAG: hypothetical protein IPI49_04935 [Myxococcales bacterium]|nr:hypothetical protein [Myxococcales bacterium]